MYILLQKNYQMLGFKTPYHTILESEDRYEIVDKLKKLVIAGCPVEDLRIVEDVPFEFKCGVKFFEEEEE